MKSDTSSIPAPLPAIDLAPWVAARPVPTEHGVDGEIVVLGPRAERACAAVSRLRSLYVVTGALTVTVGRTNHILAADSVLTLPADRAATLRNHTDSPAKVLSLRLPELRVAWRPLLPEANAVGV